MRFGVTTKRFLLYAEYAWQVHTEPFLEKASCTPQNRSIAGGSRRQRWAYKQICS